MAKFEGYERRIKQIEACLNEYGFSSLDDCKALCDSKGIDVDAIVKGVQPSRSTTRPGPTPSAWPSRSRRA